MWEMEQDSKPELDVQYKQPTQNDPLADSTVSTESEDSENAPLLSPKLTPGMITPSNLEVKFGDKISTVIYSERELASKTLARKAPEPRGTLKPQWNIIENGTITNYSPNTITLDTDKRKNTVIGKSDIAIVTQPLPVHQKQTSPPKRLIHMVASKYLKEYNRNKKK